MIRAQVVAAVILFFLCPTFALGQENERVGYALVVTNNRSLDSSRPDLHYADDDGIQYAKLFSESYGRERVILLTEPDVETMQLYPGWGAAALPPTRNQLDLAVARLKRAVAADKKRGRRVEVYAVFAGHGDIQAGRGFFALEDSRFTADDLEENLIAQLDADRIHLIIDSCNSYFMLNPRGADERRWSAPEPLERGLLEKYPNVGALISTDAEAVTYEWSELQSGIFSYEVRSALRGAADADGIAGVSYAEVAAFVHVASASITNELYRPKVFMRGPGGDSQAIIMPRNLLPEKQVALKASEHRRLTVRDAAGVRVLDVNKEAGTSMVLDLPGDDGSLYVYETSKPLGKDRPVVTVRSLADARSDVDFDSLPREPSLTTSRGEAPVFRDLFTTPFGKTALVQYMAQAAARPDAPFGVSARDVERFDSHLRLSAKLERKRRVVAGTLGITVGSLLTAQQTLGVIWNPTVQGKVLNGVLLGAAAGYLGFGIARMVSPTALERLYDGFQYADLSTGESRASALVRTEREWERQVKRQAGRRRARAFVDVILGGLTAAGSIAYMSLVPFIEPDKSVWVNYYVSFGTYCALGLVAVGSGIWYFKNPSPLEEAWKAYQDHQSSMPVYSVAARRMGISPLVLDNGGGFVLLGEF